MISKQLLVTKTVWIGGERFQIRQVSAAEYFSIITAEPLPVSNVNIASKVMFNSLVSPVFTDVLDMLSSITPRQFITLSSEVMAINDLKETDEEEEKK